TAGAGRFDLIRRLLPRRSADRVDRPRACADGGHGRAADVSDFGAALASVFGESRVGRGVVLAPFTTFKVGGPAEWLIETRDSGEILTAVQLAHAAGVAVTLLGGGSNVLVSDAGVRG